MFYFVIGMAKIYSKSKLIMVCVQSHEKNAPDVKERWMIPSLLRTV